MSLNYGLHLDGPPVQQLINKKQKASGDLL